MKNRKSLVAMSMLCACMASAFAQSTEQAKWTPFLDLEGKLGTKRNIGEGNFFIPVAQDPSTLYFANIRARFDDNSDTEGSVGGGVRHMLESGWNLGAYGFLDHRRTEYDTTWNQLTLGVEALGRDYDWRANVYNPLGNRTKSHGSYDTVEWTRRGIEVTSFGQEEHALPGFDLEAGWRLPVYDVEDARQIRTYIAGYRFSDDGIKVQGTRLRAEYVLAEFVDTWKGSQLTLGVEFQDDNARGSQSFVGLRLRIPLGSNTSSSTRLSAQERRMVAPIVRDVDVVTQMRDRALSSDLAVATANGQTLVARSSDFWSGAEVQNEITSAGANSTVLLKGTFTTSSTTTLQAGQTLMGGGSIAVRTASGRTVTVTAPGATINGQFTGNTGVTTLVTANDTTLTGMTITATSSGAPLTSNAVRMVGTGVTISNNTISVNQTAGTQTFALSTNAGATGSIINNNLIATGSIQTNGLGVGNATVLFQGNTINAQTRAINVSGMTWLAGSTGNTVVSSSNCVNTTSGGGNVGFTNRADC